MKGSVPQEGARGHENPGRNPGLRGAGAAAAFRAGLACGVVVGYWPAMSMDPLLQLLRHRGRASEAGLAEQLSLTEEEVRAKVAAWEADGTILGYQAVLDGSKFGNGVSAFIEVKVTPERGGGFDRLAGRIARFEQVSSCYLASGGYDLLLVVEGKDLMEVARFVAEKLSTMEGVLSTATHFRLKAYKENGFLFDSDEDPERLPVAP